MYTYFADFKMQNNPPEKEIWSELPNYFSSPNFQVLKHTVLLFKIFSKKFSEIKKTSEEPSI